MLRIKVLVVFIFGLAFSNLQSQEQDLNELLIRNPLIGLNFTPKNLDKVTWQRSNMLERFPQNQLVSKNNKLSLFQAPIEILSPENSQKKIEEFQKQIAKYPSMIFQWNLEVSKAGNFVIISEVEIGCEGFLNDKPVVVLNHGIVVLKNSGSLLTSLVEGNNVLSLTTNYRTGQGLSLYSEEKLLASNKTVFEKVNSKLKDDINWVVNDLILVAASYKNGSSAFIEKILTQDKTKDAIVNNPNAFSLLQKLVSSCPDEIEAYKIEKCIYQHYPEVYFKIAKTIDARKESWNGFIVKNNIANTKFFVQLIYDGKNQLAEEYFKKCIETITSHAEYQEKEKFAAKFYVDRYHAFYRIGRVSECIDLFKQTEEKQKPFAEDLKYINYTFQNNRDGLLVREEDIILLNSFDEMYATSIKEVIEAYDGKEEVLSKAFNLYSGLQNLLVKRGDKVYGLLGYFLKCQNENPKFKEDFLKLCQQKIQTKVDKAKETRDIALLLEVIEKYDAIVPLPELRYIAMEEFFKRGGYLKAISQANIIFDQFPLLHTQIISRLAYLESISDIHFEFRKSISEKLKSVEFLIKGYKTSIDKNFQVSENKAERKSGIGKFLKEIPIPLPHVQYWNHDLVKMVQPIEPFFTEKSILINGSNFLLNYSIKNKVMNWSYRPDNEYLKSSEPGPFQKRFITSKAGNQLFMLTNKDFSNQKTIKCFDLQGNLLWDVSERSDSLTEEPLCTPIEGQGKLFCLTQSNNETINSINYTVFDSFTGKILNRATLSSIPNKRLDYNSYPFPRNWNTFTHDQHFVKELTSIYGYSGTGVLFKADATSGHLIWAKGISRTSLFHNSDMYDEYGFAPSGYIQIFGDVLVSFSPDSQIFNGVNKESSDTLWKSFYHRPLYIHSRENNECLIYSNFQIKNETSVYRLDPLTGEILWQTSTKGLKISGEGSIINEVLYIPFENGIMVMDISLGKIQKIIPLKFQPLKIRGDNHHTVVLSAQSAFIFENDGNFSSNNLVENIPAITTAKVVEPDGLPSKEINIDNINLEVSLKIPEGYFSGAFYWKKTKIHKTNKPFHYLMVADEHIALFRESYVQNNGQYVPPCVVWYGQYPWHAFCDDILYVSEFGRITASDLYTREKKWSYEYESLSSNFPNSKVVIKPAIGVSKQYVAFQTENESIRVLDTKTQKFVIEISSPLVKTICIEDNYLVTLGIGQNVVRCYDLQQKGLEIWSIVQPLRSDIYTENGKLVFLKYSDASIGFYDLKTGGLQLQAKPTNGHIYTINTWNLDKDFLFAYNMLYDVNKGTPVSKFQECYQVMGGGYIGIFKKYGSEGVYLFEGKEYPLVTKCTRNHDNFNFTAQRKGNKLILVTAWWLEVFEFKDDKLILIESAKFNSGYAGDGQFPKDMIVCPLEDSIFVMKSSEMHFFKNFDVKLNYEGIQSFRVENTKNFDWPYSELYPATNVTDKNWIGYLDGKPQRKLSYQAFGNEKYAYLKLTLDPKNKSDRSYVFYISGNGKAMYHARDIGVRWDPDLWDKCQVTPNLTGRILSWKEVDIAGNISLFMRFELESAFAREFKTTLPDFNIELRQFNNNECEGMYRLGGAYRNSARFFPWLNYENDEADLLSDFQMRSAMYENKTNFYPQGEDFAKWIKDRRRFFSVENNIQLLNKMLEENSKYFCAVNILTTLFIEEVFLLKKTKSNVNELSSEFSNEIMKIIQRLSQRANEVKLNKEWMEYALSVVTVEVFPYKTDFRDARSKRDVKAVYEMGIKGMKNSNQSIVFQDNSRPIGSNPCQPYLEWILPGLMAGFPSDRVVSSFFLNGLWPEKSGLGNINFYSISGVKELCNRFGKVLDNESKILVYDAYMKLETLNLIENHYYHAGQKLNCFTFPKGQNKHFEFSFNGIKMPAVLKDNGQTAETILAGLEKLTASNDNGSMMLADYLSFSKSMDENELKVMYGKFLNSLKNNPRACYHSLRNIYQKNSAKKNAFEYIMDVVQLAKLSAVAPRMFFMEYNNVFNNKTFSFMGPLEKPVVIKSGLEFDPKASFQAENGTFKFGDNLSPQKGGILYLATKITMKEKGRVFVILNTQSFANIKISIYLNTRQVVEEANHTSFGAYYSQSLSLNAGENIVLLKLDTTDEVEWQKNTRIIIGDNFGAPIKGLEISPALK